jgi:hypothetical protein
MLPAFVVGAGPKPSEQPPAPPGLTVSFEKSAIREDDAVPVELWLSNNSDLDLTAVDLRWSGPDFVEWYPEPCAPDLHKGSQPASSKTLGTIPANSVLRQSWCLVSGPNVRVGEFNVLVVVEYAWSAGGKLRHSAVSVEKPLQVSFLGSSDIAGVPLGLAGFIIPGLLSWMVLDVFRTPWRVGNALGDKMIYSVLVSVAIVAASAQLTFWHLNQYLNVLEGVSVAKIFWLALGGTVTGTVIATLDRTARCLRNRIAQRGALDLRDSDVVLLRKLLEQNANLRRPLATVRLKDQREFKGSLIGKTDSDTVLLGWFMIKPDASNAALDKQLRDRIRAGKLAQALRLANENQIPVQPRNLIREVKPDGSEQMTTDDRKSWSNDEISETRVDPNASDGEPLEMA